MTPPAPKPQRREWILTLQDFVKLLRARWVTVVVSIVVTVLAAAAVTLMTTPLYQASTRLYVSTTQGSSLTETYQGSRLSQERVISYTELITGNTLAQRTIDKLGLNMSAEELRKNISASSKIDTVLIDVDVLDASPVRARDIANTLSDEFVVMVRELETPENGAQPDARVVVEEHAGIPLSSVIPKTKRNLAVGLALGCLLGIGLALLRDLLDNSVKDRETLEAITGTGVVGNIPFDREYRTKPIISFDQDNSRIAEAFRKLRTNLQFIDVDSPPRVIVITSPLPHEGKSSTAINLALALAEAEHNVVLVDGDMRRPKLHKYLDLIGAVGFSTVLSGGVSLAEALQRTKFPGLTVLASGPVPPNPSELLGSKSAMNLIHELRAQFDYVIIDATPLLAVTDAAILAVGADGVLFMTQFGQTRREQVTHAVASLHSVGAHLLGVVFTMVPARGGDGYYGYGYGYGYGEESSKRSRPPFRRRRPGDSEPLSTGPQQHGNSGGSQIGKQTGEC